MSLMEVIEHVGKERLWVVPVHERVVKSKGKVYRYGIIELVVPAEWIGKYVRVKAELLEGGYGV